MAGRLSEYQILVTGTNGFLGRRLVHHLLAEDAYVVGLDLAPLPLNFEELKLSKGTLIHRVGDVNSAELVEQALKEVEGGGRSYSALFHLSGLTHVGKCRGNPLTAFDANVIQVGRILEVCRKNRLSRVIYPSTALVYGDHSPSLLTEENKTLPRTVYASTKLAAEAVIQGYAGSYSFSCDIARLSNVYGSDANPDTAVNTALRQARQGGPIRLMNPNPQRDFIYCEDVVEGLIRLLTSGQEPGCRIFNLSTGKATSIGQMAKMVCEIAGIKSQPIESGASDAREDSRLVLANDRLVKRTRWCPVFTLEMGLKAAWEQLNG